jgi:hypothetical protein
MDLTTTELDLVDEALQARIRTMTNELVHTDDRTLREQLKKALAELEALEHKFSPTRRR